MNPSGDSTRVVHPLFQAEDDGSTPISPLQLHVGRIDIEKALQLNALWHSRLPIFKTGFCQNGWAFGAIFANLYYATAIWSNPVARFLPQDTCMELRRFAISDDSPKNTASRMLKVMVAMIRREWPQVTRLISYQDVGCHRGTIYKASGWKIGGEHVGGSWDRPNSRNLSGSPRTRPDLNGATGPKIRWEFNP